jgi:hypothetical protein
MAIFYCILCFWYLFCPAYVFDIAFYVFGLYHVEHDAHSWLHIADYCILHISHIATCTFLEYYIILFQLQLSVSNRILLSQTLPKFHRNPTKLRITVELLWHTKVCSAINIHLLFICYFYISILKCLFCALPLLFHLRWLSQLITLQYCIVFFFRGTYTAKP